MKKSIILLGLTCLFATTSSFAGGTLGGNPGTQNTVAYGVIVQWQADVCGTLNGKETDATKCTAK
ncbi:hypothetical protein KW489_20300 [Vibrio fluvialis]|nr:hypothetical protein [Vibrio fluvialis]